MQKILSTMRRAITDYDMIKDGDRIAVGVSGGKDSLLLLSALKAYNRFSPERFELAAITIDMGFKNADESEKTALKQYIADMGVPYYVIETDIAEIIFDLRKESNPCSLCSKMRRGALNNKAIELGFNKLALGHHADDLIETLFLSLFYESRLSTFSPVTKLERKNITVIRPMIYIREKEIAAFAKDKPIIHNPCPANKHTKRQYVKDLLKSLEKDNKKIKENVLGAITHPERNGLFDSIGKNNS